MLTETVGLHCKVLRRCLTGGYEENHEHCTRSRNLTREPPDYKLLFHPLD
jgi:hypothetical protein